MPVAQYRGWTLHPSVARCRQMLSLWTGWSPDLQMNMYRGTDQVKVVGSLGLSHGACSEKCYAARV